MYLYVVSLLLSYLQQHSFYCSLKSKWYKVVYNIRYKKSSPSKGLTFVVALKDEQDVELSAKVCAQISVFGL